MTPERPAELREQFDKAREWLDAHGWHDPSADEIRLAVMMLAEREAAVVEKCAGHAEYAVNNKALREKLVARMRKGNEQHINRALKEKP